MNRRDVHIEAATSCPRCGRPLVDLAELAGIALDAHRALENMRLAVPPAARSGLAVLATALPCHSGTCTASVAPNRPSAPTSVRPSTATTDDLLPRKDS